MDVVWEVERVSLPLSDYLAAPDAEAHMLEFVEDATQDRLLRQRTARDLAYTRRVNSGAFNLLEVCMWHMCVTFELV